jgi:hypothetical protein
MGKVFSVDRFPSWLAAALAEKPQNAASVRLSVCGDDGSYYSVFVGDPSNCAADASEVRLPPAAKPRVRIQWYADDGGRGPIVGTKDATFKGSAVATSTGGPVSETLLREGLALITTGTQRYNSILDRQDREIARLTAENDALRKSSETGADYMAKAKGEALLRLVGPGVETFGALRLWAMRQGSESETSLAVLMSLDGGGAELVRMARRGGASYADILSRLGEAVDENERDKPAAPKPVATPS